MKPDKTDPADTEAIAEPVIRPTMRLVAVKTKARQAVLMQHQAQDLRVRERTMPVNALRGHLGECGIIMPQGNAGVHAALRALNLEQKARPDLAHPALRGLAGQLEPLGPEIESLVRRILS